MRVRRPLVVLLALALLGGCGKGPRKSGIEAESRKREAPPAAAPARSRSYEEKLEAYEALLRETPREGLEELRRTGVQLGEAGRIAHARALIAKNDGLGFGDLLSLLLSSPSPRLEEAIEEEFGGPAPQGTNWWAFWEFARAETAALARRKLAAIRWFHEGLVDLPAGEISAAEACERLAKSTGLDWVCLAESRDVAVRSGGVREPRRFLEDRLEPVGLSFRLPEGTFVVGPADRLEEMKTDVFPRPRDWPKGLRPMLERPLDLDLVDRPLPDALRDTAKRAKLLLLILPGVERSSVRVTARLRNIQAADALALLCRIGNVRAALPLGQIVIGRPEDLK